MSRPHAVTPIDTPGSAAPNSRHTAPSSARERGSLASGTGAGDPEAREQRATSELRGPEGDVAGELTDLEGKLDRALERVQPSPVGPSGDVDAEERPAAHLVVLRGDRAGRTLPLFGDRPWILGRSEAAVLPMSSKAASSEHAAIERAGDRFRLRDLESTNGTLLNGRIVERTVFLRDGDVIEVADTAYVFLTEESEGVGGTIPIHLAGAGPRAELVADSRHPSHGLLPQVAGITSPQWIGAPAGRIQGITDEGPNLVQTLHRMFRLLAMLRRHWRKLLVLPALGGALGLASLLMKPPPSEVEFEIGLRWEPPENPLEKGRASNRGEEEQFYSRAIGSFAEPALVRDTFVETGNPDPPAALVRRTANQLELSRERPGVFRGSIHTHEPHATIQFLNEHLERYVREEVQKTLRVTQSQIDFLSKLVTEKNAALLRTEQQLKEFKSEHLLELPEHASGRLAAAGELQGRQGTLRAQMARLQGELALARDQLARESPLIEAKVATAIPYRQSLTDAQRRLEQARASGLGPDHPEVERLEREVVSFERKAEEAARSEVSDLERMANPAYTQLKDQVVALQVALNAARSELSSIDGQLGEITDTVAVMPTVEAEHVRLTRTYETDKAMHSRLVERLRQAQVQRDLDRASAEARYEVVTPPHSLGIQLRKALLLRVGIGFVIGLMLALAWGAIVELRRLVRETPELRAAVAAR